MISPRNLTSGSDNKSVVINGKTFKIIKTPDRPKTVTPEKPVNTLPSKTRASPSENLLQSDDDSKSNSPVPSMQGKDEETFDYRKSFGNVVRLSDVTIKQKKPSITDILQTTSKKAVDRKKMSEVTEGKRKERKGFNLPSGRPIVISNVPLKMHTVKVVDEYKNTNVRMVKPQQDGPNFKKVIVKKFEVPYHPSVKPRKNKAGHKLAKNKRQASSANINELLARIRGNGPSHTGNRDNEEEDGSSVEISEWSDQESEDEEFLENNTIKIVRISSPFEEKTDEEEENDDSDSQPMGVYKTIRYPKNAKNEQPVKPPMKAIFYPPNYKHPTNAERNASSTITSTATSTTSQMPSETPPLRAIIYPPTEEERQKLMQQRASIGADAKGSPNSTVRTIGHFRSVNCYYYVPCLIIKKRKMNNNVC
jgi:hypothetical protein